MSLKETRLDDTPPPLAGGSLLEPELFKPLAEKEKPLSRAYINYYVFIE